jgi:Leucine-rich repeat (LRR) protein
MTISELRKKLLEAYEVNNLNRISLTLINLFKNRQYTVLQKIAEIIDELVTVSIRDDGKGFAGFMMLYHPDRAVYHISEINRLSEQNDFEGLLGYSHILKLERIEEIAASLNSFEDIDYSPVYDWDMETEGFTIFTDIRPPEKIKTTTKLIGYTFYDAIKLREFGNTDEEFPPYYLEDIDEFELSSSDINDLDGVQFCVHAKSIDLSNNRIADLSPLEALTNLEDLNLSDNEVSYIDSLGFLSGLRSLNLSNNLIDDIEPLFMLKKLDYVDLSGNKIGPAQITKLTCAGITVDF